MTDNEYPRVLDRGGCLYGQGTRTRVDKLSGDIEQLGEQVGKLRQALVSAAVSLALAAVMLAINLIAR